MTPAEFSAAGLDLGLNSPAMAEALGVDIRRVRAFEAGISEIPRVVALAVWALQMQPRVSEAAGLLTR